MKYWRKPLDYDEVVIPRGVVRIVVERCKGCGFCVEYCPKGVLVMSERFNRKGYHPPEAVKEGECVNCSLCEMICPDFAIFSVSASDGRDDAKPGEEAHTSDAPQATAKEAAS
jgi:2-oxoglutarate ferredoxin oxidoreductase subunit delta